MDRVFLFDWGNTLMVDDPTQSGKMKDWPKVSAIPGAQALLEALANEHRIYVASGAQDSAASDIESALARVGLSRFISGYFCPASLGYGKGSPEFLPAVLGSLNITAEQAVMVGDSYVKDIEPALAAGIQPVWFCANVDQETPPPVIVVSQLMEILTLVERFQS